MTTATVSLPLDPEAARIYSSASLEDQRKLRLLFSLWLREYDDSPTSLRRLMDEISDKAEARGLTPEILESILNAR